MRILRAARGLAIVQALDSLIHRKADENRSLMEQMIGRISIPTDSPLRDAAARNLRENLTTMLMDIRKAGVPAIACTTASNESGFAPLGLEEEQESQEFRKLLAEAESLMKEHPSQAAGLLREARQFMQNSISSSARRSRPRVTKHRPGRRFSRHAISIPCHGDLFPKPNRRSAKPLETPVCRFAISRRFFAKRIPMARPDGC